MIAALVLASASPAMAQDDDARLTAARERFDVAQAAYDASNYAQALEGFTEVFETMEALGHPNAILVLYNVARSNHRLGRDADALAQYERFLAEAAPDAPGRQDAARNAAELRRRLELSGEGSGPAAQATRVSPVGPVILGVGGVSLGVGVIVGAFSLGMDAEFQDACDDLSMCPTALRPQYDEMRAFSTAADVLMVTGGAIAIVGLVLTLTITETEEDVPPVSAACTEDSCLAVLRGGF